MESGYTEEFGVYPFSNKKAGVGAANLHPKPFYVILIIYIILMHARFCQTIKRLFYIKNYAGIKKAPEGFQNISKDYIIPLINYKL